jgi:hypothetical protein
MDKNGFEGIIAEFSPRFENRGKRRLSGTPASSPRPLKDG